MLLRKVFEKIYEDYWKPSRLNDYEELLIFAKNQGYKMVGILDFYELKRKRAVLDKILINRHDIDTSPRVARKLFEIEQKVYGKDGSATYYFRDTTIDLKLISEIDLYGYETGYHYENLAKCLKKYHIRKKDDIEKVLDEARNMFLKDLDNFRKVTLSTSLTVSSHGDFTNVKVGVSNRSIMTLNIRNLAKIILEAYDDIIEDSCNVRFADHVLTNDFVPDVKEALAKKVPIIMILTHPRNWEVDFYSNTLENLRRIWQGIIW